MVSRLRAALEEERQVLLAQIEGLRLAIEDEHEYRGRVVQPPPSLTSLLELKRSLSEVLALPERAAHALSGGGGGSGTSRGRAALSQHSRLPALDGRAVPNQ